jgi:serine/threonine protein phosphatase PrpC
MANKITKNVHFAFSQLPYQRNQDVIKIYERRDHPHFIASLVDGHNKPALKGDKPGRIIAEFVAEHFPQQFLSTTDENISQKAEKVVKAIDEKVIKMYSSNASAVGAFLFSYEKHDILVVVGSVFIYTWNGKKWEKPKGIGDYSIDHIKYDMDVSSFFGYEDLKKQNSLFSIQADTVVFPEGTPIFIGTDGIEELLTVDDLNSVADITAGTNPQDIINNLAQITRGRQKLQNDDATIFLKI